MYLVVLSCINNNVVVSPPGTREISSLTYRSPEVYFGKPWDQSTDIWSWGIMVGNPSRKIHVCRSLSYLTQLSTKLAQLLLAQVDLKAPGMYDAIATAGTLEEKVQVARKAMVADFDLCSVPLYAEDAGGGPVSLPPDERPESEDIYMWTVEMSEKGVSGDDIQFLVDILNPRPDVRLTSEDIIRSGYLKIPPLKTVQIFI